jgi:hypothetical protein
MSYFERTLSAFSASIGDFRRIRQLLDLSSYGHGNWIPTREAWVISIPTELISACLGLGWNQNKRRTRLTCSVGESMKQGKNAGIGEHDPENYSSGHGEGDNQSDQQASQVRPTFPSDPAATTNGRFPVVSPPSRRMQQDGTPTVAPRCVSTLPALTLAAVNL